MNNRRITSALLFACLLFTRPVIAEVELIRYKNDEGNIVIDYTIPAEFVSRGYEVITPRGKVIRKVEPALLGEELEKRKELDEMRQVYAQLKKRYSNESDLERAKERKLEDIQSNIFLNESNIVSLKKDIEAFISKAAARERAGKEVPKRISEKIVEAQNKLNDSQKLLATRKEEHQRTEKKFDADIAIFSWGVQMEQALSP